MALHPFVIPGTLVLALAGIGAAAFAFARKSDEPIPGGGSVTGTTMSPQMRSAFEQLLAGSDPDAMESSATALEPFGFLSEAEQLRAKASVLRSSRTNGVLDPAPSTPALPPKQEPKLVIEPKEEPKAAVKEAPKEAPKPLPTFAKVTTNDAPPSGDLYIVSKPNAPGIDGVGAEKNGIVTVIKKDALGDGVWSQVVWGGGPRLGPVSGFAKAKFLRPSAVGPLGTSIAGEDRPRVRCMAPAGCRLRKSPSTVSDFRAIVGNGDAVSVLKIVNGPKLESTSPGKGGWAHVQYQGLNGKSLTGWLPLEWLVKA